MLVKVGRRALLDYLCSDPGLAITFHLFKNNPVPADADLLLTDLTEADFAGYAAITGVVFPGAVINGDLHGETLSPTQTWTTTGAGLPQTIYGAYVTVTISGAPKLLFVRRFATPQVLSLPGETVNKKFDFLDDDGNVPAFGA
ncbi:MAG: hypothetical protein JOZ10_16160 [Acidobacteria bacterium]|nr:hypothetical protein [Acidobacteriota bacterium]